MTTTSKKLIPNKRFPEFEKSGEWVEKKLGDIGEIVTGKTPSTSNKELWKNEILFVTPSDIKENKYQKKTERMVTNINIKLLPIGSIMFSCIATIGKMAIAQEICTTNQQINSIIVDKEKAYNEFIYYSLQSIVSKIKAKYEKDAFSIINKTEFSNIIIHVSPLNKEQKKIADFLSSVDELIDFEKIKLEKLKEYKKGLLQNLFPKENQKVPDLRFPEFKNSGEWVEKKLDILFDFKNGYTPSKNNIAYWENGIIPWFRMEDIRENGNILHDSIQHITEIAVKNNKLFPANSIILSISATIGEFALIKCNFICNQRFVCLSLKSNSFDIMYCYYYMNNISKWCKNNVHNNTFAAINIDELKKLSILFPSLEEQQKIAGFLSSIDELIIEQTTKLQLLCDYKKGLLQQLFPN